MNRWTSLKGSLISGNALNGDFRRGTGKSQDCHNVNKAIDVRRALANEMQEKIKAIQNEGLDEMRVRELNDDINRLSRKKHRWELRVAQLGGPNFLARKERTYDANGNLISGAAYKYYGAARNLPGVKELLARSEDDRNGDALSAKRRRTRDEILQRIKEDYYGYQPDEEDPALIAAELKAEKLFKSEIAAKSGSGFLRVMVPILLTRRPPVRQLLSLPPKRRRRRK